MRSSSAILRSRSATSGSPPRAAILDHLQAAILERGSPLSAILAARWAISLPGGRGSVPFPSAILCPSAHTPPTQHPVGHLAAPSTAPPPPSPPPGAGGVTSWLSSPARPPRRGGAAAAVANRRLSGCWRPAPPPRRNAGGVVAAVAAAAPAAPPPPPLAGGGHAGRPLLPHAGAVWREGVGADPPHRRYHRHLRKMAAANGAAAAAAPVPAPAGP